MSLGPYVEPYGYWRTLWYKATSLLEKLTSAQPSTPPSPEMLALAIQVRDLQEALARVQTQLTEVLQANVQQASTFHVVAANITEDCSHWKGLLAIHAKWCES